MLLPRNIKSIYFKTPNLYGGVMLILGSSCLVMHQVFIETFFLISFSCIASILPCSRKKLPTNKTIPNKSNLSYSVILPNIKLNLLKLIILKLSYKTTSQNIIYLHPIIKLVTCSLESESIWIETSST